MLFVEEDCFLIDFSASGDSCDDFLIPGAVDLPHDFSLVSQQIKLTPIQTTIPDLSEQDLFFIPDADSANSSPCLVQDDEPSSERPRKKMKRHEAAISPVSVCTIAQPFDCTFTHATPPPPLPLFSKQEDAAPDTPTSRYYNQLACLSERMCQSEESRQKVTEHRKSLAHVYASMGSSEASLFTTSKAASAYRQSRMALLSSLRQAMNASPPSFLSSS